MRRLFLIGGTMGVGKTTVSQYLKTSLTNSVFLDGDWCWEASPFQVTDETKEMVMNNICYMLNYFINCSAYENIIFCWVMHEQSIIDTIIARINSLNCEIKVITLTALKEELSKRIMSDVKAGKQSLDVLDRSIERLPFYNVIDSIKIETDFKSVMEIANEIREL